MNTQRKGLHLFVGTIILAVCLVAGTGLWLSGSPSKQRFRRLDDRRTQDLQQISSAIEQYWNMEETLPPSFADMTPARNIWLSTTRDPETGATYEYRVISYTEYELCANFSLANVTGEATNGALSRPEFTQGFSEHSAGRSCFTRTVTRPIRKGPML